MSAWAVGLAAIVAAALVWRAMGPSARVAALRGLGAGLGALGHANGA
jgi:hypothetical protein